MLAFIIIILLAAVIVIWAVVTVNGFKKKEIRISETLSGVEVALTKRYDMLTKLMDTARGYMTHEKEMFETTVRLRSGMDIGELNRAQAQIDELSGRIYAVAEGYPELRSSEVFTELQRGIRDAEDHLQAARRLYNSSVKAYNTAISIFPSSLLAGGRQPAEFFRAEGKKLDDIEIRF